MTVPLKIEVTEATLRGFGTTFDLATGTARNWYVGADGIRRWADSDKPTEQARASLGRLLGEE